MKILDNKTVEYEIINKSSYLQKIDNLSDKEIFDRYFIKDSTITKENSIDIFYQEFVSEINTDKNYNTFYRLVGANNNHLFAVIRDRVVPSAQDFGYKINNKNLIKDINAIITEEKFKFHMLDATADNTVVSKFIEEIVYKFTNEVLLQKGLRNNLLKNHEATI